MSEEVNMHPSPVFSLYAHTIWDACWLGQPKTDPRLDTPCLVREGPTSEYWWGEEVHVHDRNAAHVWTPRRWFDHAFVPADCVFEFLEGVRNVYPKAEDIINGLNAMRTILSTRPNRFFLARVNRTGEYVTRNFLENGLGCRTVDRNIGGCFRADEIQHERWAVFDCTFEILPADFVPPKLPKPKLDRILSGTMIEALQTMPTDQVIRTQVWSLIKQPIPEDKKTFEEIKSWIEENYDPKPSGLFRAPRPDDPFNILTAVPPEPQEDGFDIPVTTRRRVHGFCHYHANEIGSGSYTVTREMIERAAREAEGDSDVFEAILKSLLRESVMEDPPDDTEDHDEETNDHEINDADEMNVRIDGDLGGHALAWLRRYHPDLAETLDPGHMEDAQPAVTMEQVAPQLPENPQPSVMGLEEDEPEDDTENQ